MTQIFPNENFSPLNFLIQPDPLIQQKHLQMQALKKKNSTNINNKKAINSKQQKQINQLVRAGDWICLICNNLNFSFRNECNRCQVQTKKQNYMQNLLLISSEQHKNNMPFAQIPQQQHLLPLWNNRKPLDDLTTTINNNSINLPAPFHNNFNNNTNISYFFQNQQQAQNQNQQSQQIQLQQQQQQSNSQQSINQNNNSQNNSFSLQNKQVSEANSFQSQSYIATSPTNENAAEIMPQNNQQFIQQKFQLQQLQQNNESQINQQQQQTQMLQPQQYPMKKISNQGSNKEGFENVLLLTPPKHIKYSKHYFVSPSSDLHSSSSRNQQHQNHYQTYKSPQRLLPSMSPLMKVLTNQESSSNNTTAAGSYTQIMSKQQHQQILNTCFDTYHNEEENNPSYNIQNNYIQNNDKVMNLSRLLHTNSSSSVEEHNNNCDNGDCFQSRGEQNEEEEEEQDSTSPAFCTNKLCCQDIQKQLKNVELIKNGEEEDQCNNSIDQNFKYFQNKLKNLSNNKNFFVEKDFFGSRISVVNRQCQFLTNLNIGINNENYEQSILNLLNEDKENINYTNFSNKLSIKTQQQGEKINLSTEKNSNKENLNAPNNDQNNLNFSQQFNHILN